MRIAIIGAGFAGLSTAWYLLQQQSSVEVVVFDAKGIGGGASGIAAGLLHPYVGVEGRRSLFATEALQEAVALLALVQSQQEIPISTPGIMRQSTGEKQQALFLSHGSIYKDIELLEGNRFWIHSGQTVDCPVYLSLLWKRIEAHGGRLVKQQIQDLKELNDFDQIIVAAGGGVPHILGLDPLPISILKGQVLVCEAPSSVTLPRSSLISKGYLAFLKGTRVCYVGSTYERSQVDEIPDPLFAKPDLFGKIEKFFPPVRSLVVLECKAALRTIRKGHYFPILAKQGDRVWILTAMGSRGLLYHALLGKVLARAVIHNDVSLLDPYRSVALSD